MDWQQETGLARLLLRKGVVSEFHLVRAKAARDEPTDTALAKALLAVGAATWERMYGAAAGAAGVRFVDLAAMTVPFDVLEEVRHLL